MREEIRCLQKIGYVVAGIRISSHIVRFSWFLFLKHPFLKTKSIKGKYFKLRVKLTKSYTVCIMCVCVCYMQFGDVGSTHVRFASIFIILWREEEISSLDVAPSLASISRRSKY